MVVFYDIKFVQIGYIVYDLSCREGVKLGGAHKRESVKPGRNKLKKKIFLQKDTEAKDI